MDCVRIPSVEKGEWVYDNTSNKKEKKASRFSRMDYERLSLALPTGREKLSFMESSGCNLISFTRLDSHQSNKSPAALPRSASTNSSTSLEVTDRDQGMFAFNGERNVPYGTVLIVLLFIASISSYNSDSQSKNIFFRSHQVNPDDRVKSKNSSNRLGSAMIESVTEIFSPILPFTGGMDLRQKSWRNLFGLLINSNTYLDSQNTSSAIGSQNILFSPRGGQQDNSRNVAISGKNSKQRTHTMSLSANEPFVSTDRISEMTLKDVSLVFRYAIESGRDSLNSKTFFSKYNEGLTSNQRLVEMMEAMDTSVSSSRGIDVLPAKTTPVEFDLTVYHNNYGPLSLEIGYGDIDALQFCAAMRIFAEWRLLRQVPPGYKAYAVGMNLGYKDIVQNVAKIEKAVHQWIQSADTVEPTADDGGVRCIANDTFAGTLNMRRSPTLRQLLLHEIEMDIHPSSKLPRLKDNTAAMGLLWVRRQLHYQTVIFRNVNSVPEVYPSVMKAVGAAYTEVYDKFHGWAVQKIFNYSFQAAPDAEEIFRHMNPVDLARIKLAPEDGDGNDIIDYVHTEDPVIDESNPYLDSISLQEVKGHKPLPTNIVLRFGTHIASEWGKIGQNIKSELGKIGDNFGSELDKIGQNIGSEWDKIGQNIGGEFDKVSCRIGKILHHEDDKDCEEKISMRAFQKKGEDTSKGQSALSGMVLEEYINEKMTLVAKKQIANYLLVAQPLLADLAGLFAEMNMDDPKVV